AYSQTLSVSGGAAPYSWAITSGGLPPGLTLTSSTGVIAGTPTTAGTFGFAVTVTEGGGRTDTRPFAVVISAPTPVITTASPLPAGTVGAVYAQTLAATGGAPPYAWSITTGSLPPLLTLDAATGAIRGTVANAGNFNFVVRVSDANSRSDTKAFALTINEAAAQPL